MQHEHKLKMLLCLACTAVKSGLAVGLEDLGLILSGGRECCLCSDPEVHTPSLVFSASQEGGRGAFSAGVKWT
jgi:hypothetical protein